MKLPRRQFLHLAAGAAALPVVQRRASALDYPTRPVRIIVGFPAGSLSDTTGRLIAQALSERLGQQFVVDDRPGAGSNIATEFVVRAQPDGYTLLMVGDANAKNATLYDNLNFNFIQDIVAVAGVSRTPGVLVVNPSFPATSVPEFIAYVRANPDKINMASSGVGSTPHVAGELFNFMAGTRMVHVAYRGSVMPDLIGGQVQVTFTTLPSAIGFIRAGKVRALAVTSATPSDALPGIPTIGEFVPGYEASAWVGLGAPSKTPGQIIDVLSKASNAIVADPNMKARFADLGLEPMPMMPAEFEKFIADEIEKWAKVIKFANIKLE